MSSGSSWGCTLPVSALHYGECLSPGEKNCVLGRCPVSGDSCHLCLCLFPEEEDQIREYLSKQHLQVRGLWWGAPLSTEGAGKCDCEATLKLRSVMTAGSSAQRLEESDRMSPLSSKRSRRTQGTTAVSLTSVPRKTVEQLILETTSRHMKEKKIMSRQHGFTKEKSCLNNLIALCNEMTILMDEGNSGCCFLGLQEGRWHCPL